jgi:hypothetical protein
MDDDGLIAGFFFGILASFIFVMIVLAIADIPNAGENGQCDAIGGEYVPSLEKCVVDDDVVPLPGNSE